jgi:hypothetical protein
MLGEMAAYNNARTKHNAAVRAALTAMDAFDSELAAVPLVSHEFHGEWTYTVGCGRRQKPRRTAKSKIK